MWICEWMCICKKMCICEKMWICEKMCTYKKLWICEKFWLYDSVLVFLILHTYLIIIFQLALTLIVRPTISMYITLQRWHYDLTFLRTIKLSDSDSNSAQGWCFSFFVQKWFRTSFWQENSNKMFLCYLKSVVPFYCKCKATIYSSISLGFVCWRFNLPPCV